MARDEFIVGVSRDCVGDHARKNGWQSWGRTSWRKQDGTIVHYLHFLEQAVAVDRGDKVHAVGISLEMEIALERRGGIIIWHE